MLRKGDPAAVLGAAGSLLSLTGMVRPAVEGAIISAAGLVDCPFGE